MRALPGVPAYLLPVGLAFPELAGIPVQNTAVSERQVAALTLSIAYVLTGNWFPGSQSYLTTEAFHAELEAGAQALRVPLPRMFEWAGSIIKDPTETLAAEHQAAMPRKIWDARDGWLTPHAYQLEKAAWSAARKGSCSALSCGVGKTIVGVIAARTAAEIGNCSRERLLIVCPVNAVAVWARQVEELKKSFALVDIKSSDSTHTLQYLDGTVGGALIVDEGHRFREETSRRGHAMMSLRTKFDWCILLTGTFANTGLAGVVSMQDIACPGLSRITNELIFGEHFDAVKFEKVGRGNRRRLTFCPDERKEDFAKYLERSTYSLSLESPEVAAIVQVPGQRKLDIDTWGIPKWIQQDIEAEQKKSKDLHKDAWTESTFWKSSPIAIPSLVPWDYYLGASAVAIMEEQRDRLEAFAVAEGFVLPSALPLSVEQLEDVHQRIKDALAIAKLDPDVPKGTLDQMKEQIKWFGLPDFSRVLANALRTGRVDRVVRQAEIRGNLSWAFQYAPGSSYHDPAPGHKIEWLRQWIKENPKEPILLGAQGTISVNMMSKMLDQEGKKHAIIRGGVDAEDRGAFEKAFQAGDLNYLLVQQKAGSECLTLTRAAYSALIDRDNSSLVYTQYLARTCRQSQKRECEHFDLIDNPIQGQQLRNLRKGNDFDAETRRRIEESVNYARFLPS